MKVFINYKHNVEPDHTYARQLETSLLERGFAVFRDESGLAPGEVWPERLRKEVKRCAAMVSLVSNESLKSEWVLNELDYAKKLKKTIVPVRLEKKIEDELEFTAFRPRFMMIQWLDRHDEFAKDVNAIVDALEGSPKLVHQDLVEDVLHHHKLSDPVELLCAFLWLFRFAHGPAFLSGNPGYNDNYTSMARKSARSVPESIRNLAEDLESVYHQNAENHRKKGAQDAEDLELFSSRMKCIKELVVKAIDVWNNNWERHIRAEERQAKATGRPRCNYYIQPYPGGIVNIKKDDLLIIGGKVDKGDR